MKKQQNDGLHTAIAAPSVSTSESRKKQPPSLQKKTFRLGTKSVPGSISRQNRIDRYSRRSHNQSLNENSNKDSIQLDANRPVSVRSMHSALAVT